LTGYVQLELQDSFEAIWRYYESSLEALALLREELREELAATSPATPGLGALLAQHYQGLRPRELDEAMEQLVNELENEVSLALIACFEATLRLDLQNRVRGWKRDKGLGFKELRKEFRRLEKAAPKKKLARVKWGRILDAWKRVGDAQVVGQLKPVFRRRHWLAHGRWFTDTSTLTASSPSLFKQRIDDFFEAFPQAKNRA